MSIRELQIHHLEELCDTFIVLNREAMQVYKEDRPHILISVSDPKAPLPTIPENEKRLGFVRLQFYDLDYCNLKYKEKFQEYFEGVPDPVFNVRLATIVLDFYEQHRAKCEAVIVNCEAGISRSAAIAAALCKIEVGHDSPFFKKYIPNRRVYSLLLSEYYKKEFAS